MKTILFRILAAVSLMTVLSCTREAEPEMILVENPAETGQGKTYTLTVVAQKDDSETRALSLDGHVLSATWEKGDVVTVYKDEQEVGSLIAQGSGVSTTLAGQVTTDDLRDGDKLMLKFLSPDYGNQEGTLDYIAAHCDYATAEVEVSLPSDGSTITVGDARFVSRQAIVRFSLKLSSSAGLFPEGVDRLVIQAGDTEITVLPETRTGVLFVAMPAMEKVPVDMTAFYGGGEFIYNKKEATFESGKYYEIGVRMSWVIPIPDERTLRAFLTNEQDMYDGTTGRITKNITLHNAEPYYDDTRDIEVFGLKTIDLNGKILSGKNLSRLFSISESARLTLTGGGTIKGGNADNGGAIHNAGDLVIKDVKISDNTASQNGGAIYNDGGSITIEGGSISHNTATIDGGGIHMQGGTLVLTGGTISGNNAVHNCGGVNITNGGMMTVSGGSIENNTAGGNDGGVYVGSGPGTLIMTGGSITGNAAATAARGGGISVNGTLKMSGDPQVYNNTANGMENDVYLNTGKTIMITGQFDSEAHVGVNVASPGVFTDGFGAFNPGDFFPFFTGSNGYIAELEDGEGWMSYAYYEASWNESTREVEYTKRPVPHGVVVENICTSKYTDSGGTLNSQNWYVAKGTATVGNSGSIRCGGGDIHLILCDGTDFNTQGLYVDAGSTLYIHSQSYGDKMGKLTSTNGEGNPGIGSSGSMGTLIIHGGDITATGSMSGGAGIGGGKDHGNGPISIYGGNITATGRGLAAGIGGGRGASQGGAINIYGGTVHASGSWHAGYDVPGWGGAGIGGGSEGKGGSVNIFGGYVEADAVDGGAGIGGGATKSGGTTCISGGSVLVTCRATGGAGIGGGRDANCGTVKITGGYVEIIAKGDAAIGTGGKSTTADITITGGTVDMKRDYEYTVTWPLIGNDPLYTSNVTFVLGDFMKVETTPGQPVSTASRESTCLAERQKALRISDCDHHFDSDGQCLWCRYHR